jgi:uncharacterized membrane protein
MPPYAAALVNFGHLLGAVMGIGGLLYLGLAVLPAAGKVGDADRERFLGALRWRGRALTGVAVVLLLATGLIKWLPATGGVGWLGHGGLRTAFLHGKIALALVVFHLALKLARAPRDSAAAARRPGQVRLAALLGVVVILLASLHRTGV